MNIDKKKILKKVLPAGIVLLAIILMMSLIKLRPEPRKKAPDNKGVLINVEPLNMTDWEVTVSGTATAKAGQEVSVIPQVTGTVKSLGKGFAEGGFFKKGQTLLIMDDHDYRLAFRQARASEARAEYELEQIKSRAGIAKKEWEIISGTPGAVSESSQPNPLVLYEPQLKNAQAALESASAMVDLAKLNLERTTIRAPFDCRVRTKNVDVGQFVRSGTQVALLASTAKAEVVMPLDRDELRWIDIPGPGPGSTGSTAMVSVSGAAPQEGWQGRVVRSGGEVDMKSRMVQVVVEVDDPYGLKKANKGRAPLMNGTFVNVSIKGRTLKDVFVIPRAAIRDDSTVWTMDPEGYLRIKGVDILRYEHDSAIITEGLADGDVLVITKVSGAADGMKLRAPVKDNTSGIRDTGLSNTPEPAAADKPGAGKTEMETSK
jgi:RND family efflux transporter MFP subunit